ncbi:MAG: transposase [Opitutales bacterium]|nr:transposase [Opitutales bacterium]
MPDEEACVHVMSRVVQKRFLIDDRGMEEMRRILRTQAEFAGLDVITFCFLKNHFHILLHIDPKRAYEHVADDELVRRFRTLYGSKRSPSIGADTEGLEALLEHGGERATRVRERLKARMGDVSVFMRELKTRFTFWYNRNYQTVGTFWAERFRSVLVEPGSEALRTVAAYIDLNAVKAGLAEEPTSYRFCGLGEATMGNRRARSAYGWLMRRRRGRTGSTRPSEEIFSEYAAHVERIVKRLQIERAANQKNHPDTLSDQPPVVEEDPAAEGYRGKKGAIGSAAWISHLCQAGGPFRPVN